jgi:hypothetical protein
LVKTGRCECSWRDADCRNQNGRFPNFGLRALLFSQAQVRRSLFAGTLALLLTSARMAFGQTNVVVDFEKAEITGRWIESYEQKGVVFTPAHAPTRSKAKAKLMFFPHIPSGRKGILSAMADDPIPVRARFPTNASSVTIVFWGSTGCAAKLEAFDQDGKLVDKASIEVIPGRKVPGDPVPTFELTVKGTNIAYVEFSGPRAGEYLAAEEVRIMPSVFPVLPEDPLKRSRVNAH